MDSKQIRSFDTINECVKHFLKQGQPIKKIAMAFSHEHTIVIGKYSINVAPMKRMKKKERSEHLKTLFPSVFSEKTWLDRFEKEFAKWNAK
jgi:hypothetical protein